MFSNAEINESESKNTFWSEIGKMCKRRREELKVEALENESSPFVITEKKEEQTKEENEMDNEEDVDKLIERIEYEVNS